MHATEIHTCEMTCVPRQGSIAALGNGVWLQRTDARDTVEVKPTRLAGREGARGEACAVRHDT